MFEKRLKIFLLILSFVVIVLLGRAAQLQVVQAAEWKAEAARTLQHASTTPTIRGSLLDRNGYILAKDVACVDACVEYPALTPLVDSKWLTETATNRLKQRLGGAWPNTPRAARKKMVVDETASVQELINTMWHRLADVSQRLGTPGGPNEEQIQAVRQNVQRRVELQKKYIWYASYQRAMKDSKPKATDPKWQKWLTGQVEDGDEIDKYAVTVGEERQAHIILHDINTDVQNELARHPEDYPGLKLMPGLRRVYPYDTIGSQMLGHMGKVMKEDLDSDPEAENQARRYLPNDEIGRAGLEYLCEPALRGTLGLTTARADDPTQNTSTPAIPGQDVRTSIDIHLQEDIQNFLGNATIHTRLPDNITPITMEHQMLHGAAVVLDVKTNEVLALVSYPSFDANKFDEMYDQMRFDQIDDPLKNRATESQFEPGSTVKPLVGLSAITQGVVGVHEGIECTGYLRLLDSRTKKMITFARSGRCWVASSYADRLPSVSHHPVPMPHKGRFGNQDGFLVYADGLERSCNVYFETVADRLGVVSLSSWMRRFGLGSRTGIGIEEGKGRVPADAPLRFGNERSNGYLGGIGQGYIAATPIQMANVAATIARNGIWMRPHLILPDTNGSMPKLRRESSESTPDRVDLHLDPQALAAAREGMLAVVESPAGTGNHARMDDLHFAGKTGTAQASEFRTLLRNPVTHKPVLDENGRKQFVKYELGTFAKPNEKMPWYRGGGPHEDQIDHAWMIGFAPADNPKVAFAVLVEYGGSGGIAAAEVARASLESCILHGILNPISPTTQPVALVGTGLMSGPSTRDE